MRRSDSDQKVNRNGEIKFLPPADLLLLGFALVLVWVLT